MARKTEDILIQMDDEQTAQTGLSSLNNPSQTSIYQLFKGIWANLINRTIAKTGDAKNLKDVVGKVNFTEIRDNFITAFGSAGWGVKGSYSKENIVDSLKRTTPLELYSQIGRLSTPTSRQSKNPVIRMPHGSQTGYFCLYETPDGEG